MSMIEIGRLLRAGTKGCVVGCKITQIDVPSLGGMVKIPIDPKKGYQAYGLIHEINIDDDGLVRQLVTSDTVSPEVILDNRLNRNVPVEISVLFIGHTDQGKISHLLPPRPPLTMDMIYTCTQEEICEFTNQKRFGYFRHLLQAKDLPLGEVLAAHLQQAALAHQTCGDKSWPKKAAQELITLLRDDYNTLMNVLSALADTNIEFK